MFRDDRAMTGLEASIVLIAFVVVASVFAYVVIGSGLYVSQKSREVVNNAVSQTASGLEVAGLVSGQPGTGLSPQGNPLLTINLSLKLPAFSSPVDISHTAVRLITNRSVNNSVFFPQQAKTVFWDVTRENPPDMLLESGEIVDLCLVNLDIPPSTAFTLEILPPQGIPSISFSLTSPAEYSGVMSIGH